MYINVHCVHGRIGREQRTKVQPYIIKLSFFLNLLYTYVDEYTLIQLFVKRFNFW